VLRIFEGKLSRHQNAGDEHARCHHGRNSFIKTASESWLWDVHHPEKTIVIDLHDERYSELVVEVDDPEAAVRLIQNAR
jgi:hypothetical protein